jgi:lantibiotic modifying enzyme
MRKPASPYPSPPAISKDAPLLVLGYHGTLQPHITSHSNDVPPAMAALLLPYLEQALAELDCRLPPDQRYFQNEPISLDGLIAVLRERLQDILTLPLAEHLAASHPTTGHESSQLTLEYPALTPLLRQVITDWVTATATFCQRLQRDSSRLAHWLGLPRLPPIASLTGTTSDMHPGGHLVLRILFRNGPSIFYKPRPLTGEWLWHALLEAIHSADSGLRLPSARVLLGDKPQRYGWMESVLPHPCTLASQSTPAYWHNAGALLCLAGLAGLSDLHLGNIIATSNGPVVTDAECLAAPEIYDPAMKVERSHGSTFQTIQQSLFATGLLPSPNHENLPDTSGLFGSATKVHALQLPYWSRSATGKPILLAAPASLLDHGNSPGPVSPLAVLPHMVNGYRHAAQALLQARHALLAQESSWRRLLVRSHAPRVVLRVSLAYAVMLSKSLDPVHLRSSQQRRYALRNMLRQPPTTILPASVLRAELHSMLHLHFPRLVLLPCSRTLANTSGTPLDRQFIRVPPAIEVIDRINHLSPQNIETMHIPALINAFLPC